MSELKPCPFCQSDHLVYSSRALIADRVECCRCGATAKADHWNIRPREQELEEEVLKQMKETVTVMRAAIEHYKTTDAQKSWRP